MTDNNQNEVLISYGKGRIPLRLDPQLARWRVIAPTFEEAMAEPREGFFEACRNPVESAPLRSLIEPNDRVVVVTSDGTRPVPNRQLIPWLLEELPVPADQVTVLLGTGTHRPNTPGEIDEMFGADVARSVKILNHDAYEEGRNECVGESSTGGRAFVDRRYLEADKRIVLGFIEPHFFAGFSGGCKGVIPGVAGIETILRLHDYETIGDPNCTWGEMDKNPIQREITEMVALCPPDFLVNVTLNVDKAITGFFVGDYRKAHRLGCERAREASMVRVPRRYPVVVTSNSGYPLDQNLYQTVKGMSAADRIVEDGGTIVVVSQCIDGIPDHGNYRSILQEGGCPAGVDRWIRDLKEPILDQWEAQVHARILKRSKTLLYSSLDRETVEAAMLTPVDDLQAAVEACVKEAGAGVEVAILPDGPLTIPYL